MFLANILDGRLNLCNDNFLTTSDLQCSVLLYLQKKIIIIDFALHCTLILILDISPQRKHPYKNVDFFLSN